MTPDLAPPILARGTYRQREPREGAITLPEGVRVPSPDELQRARQVLASQLPPTPTYRQPRLSALFNRDVWVKLESSSPIRSFKHRGALWAIHEARSSGATRVVTASTGNHGQGMALAAQQLGMAVTVFTPERVDDVKRRQMLTLGAELVGIGATLTDAEHAAKQFAADTDVPYIEDGEDPHLMAGAASIGTEILAQVPDVDTVVVPVGGGNLIAGIGMALEDAGRHDDVRLVGVQSTAAAGVTASWLDGQMHHRPCTTLAGGLATEHPGLLSLSIIDRIVSMMVLVDEDDLWNAIGWAFDEAGLTLEMAAAAPFAALRHFAGDIVGDTTVLVASGACIDRSMLVAALSGVDLASWLEHNIGQV